MTPNDKILHHLYTNFNARNIEAVLTHFAPNVDWPNGMEGGRVHGHAEIRAYWQRQWTLIDPKVHPTAITPHPDGQADVTVHQIVQDLAGTLLQDLTLHHIYTFEDALVTRMDIVG